MKMLSNPIMQSIIASIIVLIGTEVIQWAKRTYITIFHLGYVYFMRSYPYIPNHSMHSIGHPLVRIPIGSVLLSSGMYSIDYKFNFDNIKGKLPPWIWLEKHKIIYQGHSCLDDTTHFKPTSLIYWMKRKLIKCAEYGYLINKKINPSKFRYSICDFPIDKSKYTIEYVHMIEQLSKFKKPSEIIYDMLGKLNEANGLFRKSIINSINNGYILNVYNIQQNGSKLDALPYDADSIDQLTFDVSIGNGFYGHV